MAQVAEEIWRSLRVGQVMFDRHAAFRCRSDECLSIELPDYLRRVRSKYDEIYFALYVVPRRKEDAETVQITFFKEDDVVYGPLMNSLSTLTKRDDLARGAVEITREDVTVNGLFYIWNVVLPHPSQPVWVAVQISGAGELEPVRPVWLKALQSLTFFDRLFDPHETITPTLERLHFDKFGAGDAIVEWLPSQLEYLAPAIAWLRHVDPDDWQVAVFEKIQEVFQKKFSGIPNLKAREEITADRKQLAKALNAAKSQDFSTKDPSGMAAGRYIAGAMNRPRDLLM